MIGYQASGFIAAVMAVAAFAANTDRTSETARAPIECAAFRLDQRIIEVGPAGGTYDFGHNHRLVFPAGALSVTASYNVIALPPVAGRQGASVQVLPLGGAPRTFLAPITVRIGYQDCAIPASNPPLRMERRSNPADPWEPIGGGDWRVQQWVEGYSNHLSAFAIAH